jgi:hypothetical protein
MRASIAHCIICQRVPTRTSRLVFGTLDEGEAGQFITLLARHARRKPKVEAVERLDDRKPATRANIFALALDVTRLPRHQLTSKRIWLSLCLGLCRARHRCT